MQGTDIPALEAPLLLLACAHLRGVSLRPAQNAPLLGPEQPINDIELLLKHGSCYNI